MWSRAAAVGPARGRRGHLCCAAGTPAAVLGVSRQQLAEIMVEYGAVNAGNLDGGASSDMYFNGEYVNVCNTSGGPRGIPTAVVVMPVQ